MATESRDICRCNWLYQSFLLSMPIRHFHIGVAARSLHLHSVFTTPTEERPMLQLCLAESQSVLSPTSCSTLRLKRGPVLWRSDYRAWHLNSPTHSVFSSHVLCFQHITRKRSRSSRVEAKTAVICCNHCLVPSRCDSKRNLLNRNILLDSRSFSVWFHQQDGKKKMTFIISPTIAEVPGCVSGCAVSMR